MYFLLYQKKKKVNEAREIKCKAFSEVSDLNFQSVLTIHALLTQVTSTLGSVSSDYEEI